MKCPSCKKRISARSFMRYLVKSCWCLNIPKRDDAIKCDGCGTHFTHRNCTALELAVCTLIGTVLGLGTAFFAVYVGIGMGLGFYYAFQMILLPYVILALCVLGYFLSNTREAEE